jgi:protein ImuB
MPLGTAHRLAPEATFLDPDPQADREAVEAALERLASFSPGLNGTSDQADPSFGLLTVHVDGLERLWGDDRMLVGRIEAALQPILPGPFRAGVAGTRFGATIAAARATPPDPVVVPAGAEPAFLEPLPSGLLTADLDVRARLTRLGLRRIGQVAAIPRSALVARFGAEGERIGARARAEETDPFRPRRTPERLRLGLPIEPPVDDLDALRFVLHRLCGALADQLVARGAATARSYLRLELDTTFVAVDTPHRLVFEQRFPEPTSEAEAIERLFLARLERTPPPAPVERLELELVDVRPAAGQQLPLFVPQAARGARLAWQLARLALAYGEDRIRRLVVLDPEAPLAELQAAWQPVGSGSSIDEGAGG